MNRLTTNKPVNQMETYELAHNCMFAKDGEAWFRDFENEVSLRNMIRAIMKKHTDYDEQLEDDEILDEVLFENLQFPPDGDIDGLIAVFNMIAWAHADLRERLKHYEDLEEAGKLITLPCKRGDTVYYIYMDCPSDYKEVYCIDHQGGCANCHHRVPTIMSKKYTLDDIDMPVYLTEQKAKEALEGMKNVN